MFKKDDHCMTIRIGEELPEEQQQLLWGILESFVNSKKIDQIDRLQIFKLSVINVNGNTMQQVTHIQEHASFVEKNIFAVAKPIKATVFAYLEEGQTNLM